MLAILFIVDVEGCASNETIQFPSVTWWKAKLNQQITTWKECVTCHYS